jgi:predicted HicB family RNase H-like nuclease
MSKTSTASKNKYNAKAYDRVNITFKKGKKEVISNHAKSQGLSLNAYINKLISDDMGDKLNADIPMLTDKDKNVP